MAPLVSIVVNNYNYARFLPAAIDSALSQDHDPLEVVVVDDGSTDGSREIIARYGDRIRPVFKENGGHASALNAGFQQSSGEIVMFLDADDLLEPTAAGRVVKAATDGCAKVQYRLSIVDQAGNKRGVDPPLGVPMPNGNIVPKLLETGRYTTPVTTGNAYPRTVLDQIMPIPEREFTIGGDGYLNVVSPFYGDIVSIDDELGGYRHHGSNRWAFSGEVTAAGLRARIEHDLLRERFLRRAAERHGHSVPPDLSLNDWSHVVHRLSLLRLEPASPTAKSDSRLKLMRAGVRAIRRSPVISGPEKVYYQGFVLTIGALPRRLATPVVKRGLANRPRPRWVRFLARAVRRAFGVLRRG